MVDAAHSGPHVTTDPGAEMQHRHLLSPLQLRGQTLRNRIGFGAHTANMSDQGIQGPRDAKYLLERALGGAARISSSASRSAIPPPMPFTRGASWRLNYSSERTARRILDTQFGARMVQ